MNGSNALYTLLGTVLFIITTELQITAYNLLFSIVPNENNKYSNDMKEQQLELLTKVATGELSPKDAQTELLNLFSVMGSFSIDDIKEVYNIGRAHELNGSDCTATNIGETWLKADDWNRDIKWE